MLRIMCLLLDFSAIVMLLGKFYFIIEFLYASKKIVVVKKGIKLSSSWSVDIFVQTIT